MMLAALVLATEAEEAAGGLDLVLPAQAELIWGFVGFALLFVILSKYAFPLLNTMLSERAAKIEGQLEEAESVRVEAEELRRQYREQLADARSQANEIIEQAKRDADRVKADLVAKAETEAEAVRNRARDDAESERGRLLSDLRQQVATIGFELAGKIVQQEIDPQRHRELVDQYINELSGMN